MQKLVKEYLSEWKKQQKKRRRIGIAAMILIVMVVSCVIGSLTQYGVALTGDPKCGMEEHQHNDSCYTSVLTCKQEESEGHQHNDSCYTTITELTCGQEEGEEHQHDDSCYTETSELTCGQEESDGHTHTDECYTEEFTCDMEEHTHTDECYTDADVEDASVWNLQYENVEWTGSWGENLVTAARIQIGYKESTDNYIAAEDGSHKGYTRYGQFAKLMYDAYANDENIVYTDWDAAFTDFCLFYAGLKETGIFPDEIDAAKWCEEFIRKNEQSEDSKKYLAGLKEAGDDTPAAGDIVFFEREKKTEDGIIEKETRMGIVSSYNKENNQIRVIEGNYQDQVKENDYSVKDGSIARYVKTTEIEKLYKGVDEKEEETESTNKDNQLEEPEIKDTEEKTSESNKLNQKKNIRELENESAVNAIGEIQEEENKGSEIPSYVASIPINGSQSGKMILELRYGKEEKRHDELEAEVVSPHYEMTGNIVLYAKDLNGESNINIDKLEVTLHFPKDYIDKDTIKFLSFKDGLVPADESNVSRVEEDEQFYKISITFKNYKQVGQLMIPFNMKYYGGIVPADYELKVYGTIFANGNSANTAENTYKPEYTLPTITKYVNTNQYDNMAKDYTKVSAKVENGVIQNDKYVSFWYKLGKDPWFYREYDKITLIDTLPEYPVEYEKDENGEIKLDENGKKIVKTRKIAEFDPDVNQGWKLAEDGKTVYKVVTTDKSCTILDEEDKHWRAALDLQKQIEETELKLQFPGCIIDEDDGNNFLKKDLKNNVEAKCHPHNPSQGEKEDSLTDDLIFTLTSQPSGAGFAKYNSSNTIMDTKVMREGLYRWGINFENSESPTPLKKIILKDFELDERLKIHTLWLDCGDKTPGEAKDYIARIEAVDSEGKTDIYTPENFSNKKYEYGWGWYQSLLLNSTKVYKSFTVYTNQNFELPLGQKIHIDVYTTFREAEKSHYVDNYENKMINIYQNKARVEYSLDDTTYYITSGNQFELIAATENIRINKIAYSGAQVEPGRKDYFWLIQIIGSLKDSCDYEDLRIIDLLPESFTLPKNKDTEEKGISFGTGGEYVKDCSYVENYKNTGRMAVVLKLNADKVKEQLAKGEKGNGLCQITLKTEVPSDARVGMADNEAWLLSDDFDKITSQNFEKDQYDLDDDGDRDERIRMSRAACNIQAPKSIFSEKLIASAGSENWHKSGLLVGIGDSFQYKLCVINTSDSSYKGVLVYDVLPRIGDINISNNGDGRGSEYTVELSKAIEPPDGYQVYYTTSQEVYKKSMEDILENTSQEPESDVKWFTWDKIEEKKQITAFKIVGDAYTSIQANSRAEFVIPVKVTDTLEQASYNKLLEKESTDRVTGTATYLISTNSFGYRVATFSGTNLESNYVNAQIPFAGFVIQKVDSMNTDEVLPGAAFTLKKKKTNTNSGTNPDTSAIKFALSEYNVNTVRDNLLLEEENNDLGEKDNLVSESEWEFEASGESGEDGTIAFKNLTEGTYQLTETATPAGYVFDGTPYIIEIKLDRSTMEYSYTIKREDKPVSLEGNGTSKDPFKITNRLLYELPSTGGSGIYWYMFGGMLLMSAAALMAYRKKCKGVLES